MVRIRSTLAAVTLLTTLGLTITPTVGAVAARGTAVQTAASSNTADQAKVKVIINRGDTEINRRLQTLNTLSNSISSAAKLSSSDKNTLANEVSSEISGLTGLKTRLDGDTDLSSAKADAQSIFAGYRVYALIVPKVKLVKTADDQQVTEGRLTALAAKMQTRLTSAAGKGKNVSGLQSKLSDLTSKNNSAQTISSGIESGVIQLQPSDYDADHAVLSGDRDKLKTAQGYLQAAAADAKAIVSGLQSL